MLTEEQLRKFTRATKDEMEKIGILVKMPERSRLADNQFGFKFTIDVLANTPDGAVAAAQVEITEADMRITAHDEFFRMLNSAVRRVNEYRTFVAQRVLDNPDGDFVDEKPKLELIQ